MARYAVLNYGEQIICLVVKLTSETIGPDKVQAVASGLAPWFALGPGAGDGKLVIIANVGSERMMGKKLTQSRLQTYVKSLASSVPVFSTLHLGLPSFLSRCLCG
jgi:hypothetical protein